MRKDGCGRGDDGGEEGLGWLNMTTNAVMWMCDVRGGMCDG